MSYKKILTLSESDNIFLTSDLHFCHRNILNFCKRPFNSTEEMDEALVNNWNSVVGKDDYVFDLGDFAFASSSKWKELISRLNGKHYLILGNHDISRYPGDDVMSLFERVEEQMIIKIDNRSIILNHYPFLCYAGTYRDKNSIVYNLHGHVHTLKYGENTGKDQERLQYRFPYQYDVGVDNNDYKPISWIELKEIMKKQIEQSC